MRRTGPRPHLGPRLTTATTHTCPPGRHVCAVCSETIQLTRKGGPGGTLRWAHSSARDHKAMHHVGACRAA